VNQLGVRRRADIVKKGKKRQNKANIGKRTARKAREGLSRWERGGFQKRLTTYPKGGKLAGHGKARAKEEEGDQNLGTVSGVSLRGTSVLHCVEKKHWKLGEKNRSKTPVQRTRTVMGG